jgi:hypothetical protein
MLKGNMQFLIFVFMNLIKTTVSYEAQKDLQPIF